MNDETRHPMTGARAAEVVATLGDGVVEVAHVEAGGRRGRRGSLLLLAAGVALLTMPAVTFVQGVRVSAANERAQAAWIEARRPAHDFRPRRLPAAYDWMAFGGLAGGMLAVGWGLFSLRTRPARASFCLGRDEGADFSSADAPAEGLALVRDRGDGLVVTIAPGMGGAMVRGGQVRAVAELAARGEATPSATCAGGFELPVPADGFVRADCGRVRFSVRAIERPRRSAAMLIGAFDRRAGAYVLGSALAHLGLILLLRTIPPDPSSLALDFAGNELRRTSITSFATEQERVEPDDGGGGEGDGGEPRAASLGDPGAAGNPDSTQADRRYAIARRAEEHQLSREEAMRMARDAGFMAQFRHSGDLFSSMTSLSDFSSGEHDFDALGNVVGGEYGDSHGHFGTGPSGWGPGGGGPSWGTIGTGSYATICGSGRVDGCGFGPDGHAVGRGVGPGPGQRQPVVPKVDIGPVATCDPECIDRAIIRRYIRRKLPQIQHCYERALITNPALSGTVSTRFLVSDQGRVLGAQASGTGDEGLETCVAGVVETIQFPRSPHVGSYQVVYPFSFRQAGR